jgi:hypothetical protein
MLFGNVEQHFSPSSGRKLDGKREGSGGKSTNRKPGEANPPIGNQVRQISKRKPGEANPRIGNQVRQILQKETRWGKSSNMKPGEANPPIGNQLYSNRKPVELQ